MDELLHVMRHRSLYAAGWGPLVAVIAAALDDSWTEVSPFIGIHELHAAVAELADPMPVGRAVGGGLPFDPEDPCRLHTRVAQSTVVNGSPHPSIAMRNTGGRTRPRS
jgi:hypothetical protein